jgi:transcriptional regulator
MYTPSAYQATDREMLFGLMEQFNFATLVTVSDNAPFATPLPFLLDRNRGEQGTLRAHMARANPQWQQFADGQEVLVIFQGPHAYISPAWYTSEFAVPTWNYTVIHAYGQPRLIDDQETVQQMVEGLVAYHETPRPQPWSFTWTDRYLNLLKGIVAFEIEITRLEGKAKLSQNRSYEDQLGVVQGLRQSLDPGEQQVATQMAMNLTAVLTSG